MPAATGTLPTLVLSGPTASGKSALGVGVARALIAAGQPCEIVNTDSMAIYRGMDIGTAKPPVELRREIRHHLVDIAPLEQRASVADFQHLARAAIADCHARGVVPICVGGSALYVRAIVDEFEFPGTDPALRARLQRELELLGSDALYQRLTELDPAAAAGILPNNGRRIVRALEVIELTGSFRSQLPAFEYRLSGVYQFGLEISRTELDERIAARVTAMVDAGLFAEVEQLAARGLRDGVTAARALGYRQVLAYLDGTCTAAEAIAETVLRTRQFARKQLGWFRRDPRIVWLSDTGNTVRLLSETVQALLSDATQALNSDATQALNNDATQTLNGNSGGEG